MDLQAIGQLLIAGIVAYIAWQNHKIGKAAHRIERDKFRLDLFDRRLKIFESCQNLFLFIVREGKVTSTELTTFNSGCAEAEFLFGKEIVSYVEEVRENGIQLLQLERKLSLESLTPDERTKHANEWERLVLWFSEQMKNSRVLFRKYLHFSIDKDI